MTDRNFIDISNQLFHSPKKPFQQSPISQSKHRKTELDNLLKRYSMSNFDEYAVDSDNFSSNERLYESAPIADKPYLLTLFGPKYIIKNERGEEIQDVIEQVDELERNRRQQTELITKIGSLVMFNESQICPENLDPDNLDRRERCIVNYPACFGTPNFSKFIHRVSLLNTKLSEIKIGLHRFSGKLFVIKSGYKPQAKVRVLSESSKEIVNEVKMLTRIGRHVHIVECADAWIEDESYHVQLEFVCGGSLLDFIVGNREVMNTVCDISKVEKTRRISNGAALVLLAQISSVLAYLHDDLRVFHGDIKPSNILVELFRYSSDNWNNAKEECHEALLESEPNRRLRFKLCDFGRSGETRRVIDLDEGDGRYLPMLNDNCPDHHLFATARDIYSFGLTIYDCFGGVINSSSSSDIRKGNWGQWPENISDEWRDIIQKMSHVDEKQRFTAREIVEMDKVKSFVLEEAMCHLRHGDYVRERRKNTN